MFTESENIYQQGELVSPKGAEYTTSGNTSKPSYSDEFSKLRGTMSETDLIKLSYTLQYFPPRNTLIHKMTPPLICQMRLIRLNGWSI